MFGFRKKQKKRTDIFAPVNGKAIALEEVGDGVFSEKLVGDGAAVIPEQDQISIPADGTVSFVMDTGHAFGIRTLDGPEILVHIGIDTVSLKGEGFHVKVKQEDHVKQGEVLCMVDLGVLKEKNIDATTMMIFTDMSGKAVEFSDYGKVKGNETTAAVIK